MIGDEYGWGRPGFVAGMVVLAVMLLLSGYMFLRLPSGAAIPMQIGPQGHLQNYQTKAWALLFAPALVLFCAFVMDAVPFVPYGKKEPLPVLVWYGVLAVLFLCHLFVIVNALARIP